MDYTLIAVSVAATLFTIFLIALLIVGSMVTKRILAILETLKVASRNVSLASSSLQVAATMVAAMLGLGSALWQQDIGKVISSLLTRVKETTKKEEVSYGK